MKVDELAEAQRLLEMYYDRLVDHAPDAKMAELLVTAQTHALIATGITVREQLVELKRIGDLLETAIQKQTGVAWLSEVAAQLQGGGGLDE